MTRLFALFIPAMIALYGPAAAQPAPDASETKPADVTLLRVDVEDGFGLHPWIYHEFRLSPHWGILGDVHAQSPGLNSRFPPYLEIDVGPNLHLGPLQINPQIGVDLAWREPPRVPGGGGEDTGHTKAADFIAELYLILNWNRLAAESWNLFFIPFDGSSPFYIMRLLATVRLVRGLAVGPHLEGFFFLKHDPPAITELTYRLAIGGDLAYGFRWGQLGLFLAYERQRGVAEFRLTFLREI